MKNVELVCCLGDLHYGKVTRFGFDPNVCDRRIRGYVAKLTKHPCYRKPNRIRVLLLGDLIQGANNYAHQVAENPMPVTVQKQKCAAAIWRVLIDLKRIAPVEVDTTPGSHGKKGKHQSKIDNEENDLYYMLATWGEKSTIPRLTIRPHYYPNNVIDIAGHRYIIDHEGHKHLGTPAMQVKLFKRLRHYNAVGLFHGHWHQTGYKTMDDVHIIRNGSLCGPDDLSSDEMACYDPARQVFCYVSPAGLYGFNYLEWK